MKRTNSGRPPLGDSPYVSTAQVAAALGVSVTTVKRWVDDGVLPAHRTAGGHRKLLLADLKRAVNAGNLPQSDLGLILPKPYGRAANDAASLALQFHDALNTIDVDAIRGIIHGAYTTGLSIPELADQIIAPGLAHIGTAWAEGKCNIVHEHRVTHACAAALFELRTILRGQAPSNRPVAIGGAPEHDHYLLPTLLAKLTLLESGWNAINLGPHTPFSAFKSALDDLKPRLVWLTTSHITEPPKFLAEYADFYSLAEQRGVSVAIGGNAITEPLRVKMRYTTYGDRMDQLAAFARSLHRPPQRPMRGRPPKQ